MDIVISIGMGIIIVWIALHLIKKEVMKASFFKHVQKQTSNGTVNDDVISQVQRLEVIVDEMNQSFYDIVSDLEGHYSQHEEEINALTRKVESLNSGLEDLNRSIYYQGKEIQTISKQPEVIDEPIQNTAIQGSVSTIKVKETTAYHEVMRLKALGYDEQQIAKRMNKGIREINMLLNLKK